jgi:hypothetical protein
MGGQIWLELFDSWAILPLTMIDFPVTFLSLRILPTHRF